MKRTGTNKLLVIVVALAVIVSILNFILSYWCHEQLTGTEILYGAVGVVGGMYIWKSKMENRSKATMKLIEWCADKELNDQLVQIIQAVISE